MLSGDDKVDEEEHEYVETNVGDAVDLSITPHASPRAEEARPLDVNCELHEHEAPPQLAPARPQARSAISFLRGGGRGGTHYTEGSHNNLK